MKNPDQNVSLEKIVSLAKRRGFVYPGSEIYGGLAGFWDFGPLGVALKNNIKNLWWKRFVDDREDIYGLDAAVVMPSRVLEASGHVAGFVEKLVECDQCHKRFRQDQVKETCPACGGSFGPERNFNEMFRTQVGASEDSSAISYLRPETAQGIFVNFKNVLDSFHPKLPFGIAQIGKAFRNEITPRDWLYRVREIEQMEIEYFIQPATWEKQFNLFRSEMKGFLADMGIEEEFVHELEVPDGERAHYSKRTIDFEFDFPFGRSELWGLAYRTDYDLSQHAAGSGRDLFYLDEETGERIVPHVIEPSMGVERTFAAILISAYTEDNLGGETRTYLKFKPAVAPIKLAVFPLLKNKPELVEKARGVYQSLKKEFTHVVFDDNGNIGKRYRRQDEIGTPYCVTIDFDTLTDDTVTVRDRDTGEQERIALADLNNFLTNKL